MFSHPDPISEQRYQHLAGMFPYIDKELKRTGEINAVEVYVSILGYSQLTYVQAVPSQKKAD